MDGKRIQEMQDKDGEAGHSEHSDNTKTTQFYNVYPSDVVPVPCSTTSHLISNPVSVTDSSVVNKIPTELPVDKTGEGRPKSVGHTLSREIKFE